MATPQRNYTITTYETGNSTPTKHDSSSSISSKVRVIVRVRPLLYHEISVPCVSVLDSQLEEVTVQLKDLYSCRNENYKVDSFYGEEDNVRLIFEKEVMPLIPGLVLNGSNATVFAYGATASGKTYTMQGSDEMPGVMPMATSTILSMCEKIGKTVEISYYEIYMERCYDLLEVKTKEIAILDDKNGHPHPIGLAKIQINSMIEFQEAFFNGSQRRKVAHTALNDVSSRSHGVLVIYVSNGPGTTNAKLNLIDLAGNEDNRRSGNEGVRLHESTKINQSLFVLSQVIYALNNNNARIPYRDSKLTRILQDSLGGTSHAVMVACLNPGEYEQSVHTVSLAARSRRICNFVHSAQKHNNNTPKIQVDMETKLQAWLESKGKTKRVATTPCSTNKSSRTLEKRAQKLGTKTTPMFKELNRSARKVLSPINSNVNIDPVTPKPQFNADDMTENTDTPLNKFKAMSSNLKNTLAQEYINFLNKAGKVELMQLKGIGEKMADYVLELRDLSPLKSLNDLEKIGLSSKQVGNMFGRTTKGLLID